jgi:hypothetical protein
MTQLLRVSGIAVPVLVGSASHKPMSIGDVERAEDGSLLISRRIIKETYKLQVAHRVPADGIAWKRLFIGEGQKWDFDTSLYGSKGLGPSAATASVQSAAAAKFGAGCCRQTATTGTISYAALLAGGTKWTVMFWRSVGGAAFDHYVVTSSGHKWLNGVRADGTSTTFLTVTTATGTVKLDAAGSTTDLDDLVIFPFEVPDTWPPDVFAYGAAFSKLAKLDVDGDLVEANVGTKTVRGEVTGVSVVPGTLNGTFYQAIRVVEVELSEA